MLHYQHLAARPDDVTGLNLTTPIHIHKAFPISLP
jgi:hypothetical protein